MEFRRSTSLFAPNVDRTIVQECNLWGRLVQRTGRYALTHNPGILR